MASVSKWFADEKEDAGFQIVENSKCFGITTSTMFFSNEGKELMSQYQGRCGCPGCACEEMIKFLRSRSAVFDFRRRAVRRQEDRLDDVESSMFQLFCNTETRASETCSAGFVVRMEMKTIW